MERSSLEILSQALGYSEMSKYKHQNTNKFQMTISNDPNSLEF
jgi:hypothetical protein